MVVVRGHFVVDDLHGLWRPTTLELGRRRGRLLLEARDAAVVVVVVVAVFVGDGDDACVSHLDDAAAGEGIGLEGTLVVRANALAAAVDVEAWREEEGAR